MVAPANSVLKLGTVMPNSEKRPLSAAGSVNDGYDSPKRCCSKHWLHLDGGKDCRLSKLSWWVMVFPCSRYVLFHTSILISVCVLLIS